MVNDNIRADMIDAGEFSFLVNKYNVQGVPHTVINEKESIVGAQPEMEFAKAILKAIGK
jgi:predicted DsbA family dithiol-disulfide isomerase